MLDRGFLATTSIYPTLAHDPDVLSLYENAIDKVFAEIAAIVSEGKIDITLDTPPAYTGFARLS